MGFLGGWGFLMSEVPLYVEPSAQVDLPEDVFPESGANLIAVRTFEINAR